MAQPQNLLTPGDCNGDCYPCDDECVDGVCTDRTNWWSGLVCGLAMDPNVPADAGNDAFLAVINDRMIKVNGIPEVIVGEWQYTENIPGSWTLQLPGQIGLPTVPTQVTNLRAEIRVEHPQDCERTVEFAYYADFQPGGVLFQNRDIVWLRDNISKPCTFKFWDGFPAISARQYISDSPEFLAFDPRTRDQPTNPGTLYVSVESGTSEPTRTCSGPAPASFTRTAIEAGFRKPEDKGFGDTFANMAKAVGADKVAHVIKSLGGDCGCDDRQKRWNEMYPYS